MGPQIWHVLNTVHQRITALEEKNNAPPSTDVIKRLDETEKRLSANIVNEHSTLEAKLTHKYDQMVSKLVRDQCQDIQAEMESLITQRTSSSCPDFSKKTLPKKKKKQDPPRPPSM